MHWLTTPASKQEVRRSIPGLAKFYTVFLTTRYSYSVFLQRRAHVSMRNVLKMNLRKFIALYLCKSIAQFVLVSLAKGRFL